MKRFFFLKQVSNYNDITPNEFAIWRINYDRHRTGVTVGNFVYDQMSEARVNTFNKRPTSMIVWDIATPVVPTTSFSL